MRRKPKKIFLPAFRSKQSFLVPFPLGSFQDLGKNISIALAEKREEKQKKAKKNTKNNAYGIVHGKDRYVKEETILKETGEILNEEQTVKVSGLLYSTVIQCNLILAAKF